MNNSHFIHSYRDLLHHSFPNLLLNMILYIKEIKNNTAIIPATIKAISENFPYLILSRSEGKYEYIFALLLKDKKHWD